MIYNHRFKKLGISHGKNSRVAKHVKNFLPKGFVSVGDDVVIKTGVEFRGDGKIAIGNDVVVAHYTWLYSSREGGITIGNHTMIGPFCFFIDSNHGTKKNQLIIDQKSSYGKIVIGDDCWVGAKSVVLKNTILPDHSVAGAMSLLNKGYPENAIVAGNPAKFIKFRE